MGNVFAIAPFNQTSSQKNLEWDLLWPYRPLPHTSDIKVTINAVKDISIPSLAWNYPLKSHVSHLRLSVRQR